MKVELRVGAAAEVCLPAISVAVIDMPVEAKDLSIAACGTMDCLGTEPE